MGVSALKRTRGQNLFIWARKPNLPIALEDSAAFLGVQSEQQLWFGSSATGNEGR